MNGAVITAKNEAETIGKLVFQLRELGLEICVIDDGSNDDTGKIAKLFDAHVIRHETSKGIGKSLVEAWQYAIEQEWEHTVQIDAGGSHYPADAGKYIKWIKRWELDIAIGSRFCTTAMYIGRSWRAVASKFVASILNWTTHQDISDWTSGYRVFSRKALIALVDVHYLTNMHTWQIEVLGEAIKKKLVISEFPITYRAGNSSLKLSTIHDLIKVYLWIFNR